MADYKFVLFDVVHDVGAWDRAEEVPTGSREKLTVIEPSSGEYYIFKYPKERREHQLWSELLASFIAGDLLGWDVQHTAIASRDGRMGNLLRYIYEPGRGNSAQETFIEGWTLCTQIDPDYDVRKGTHHSLPLLLRVGEEVLAKEYGLSREDFLDYWARAFALDTLISNTDRHAENWAVITGPEGARMAPLYDHGSSMGCGIDRVGLDRAFSADGALHASHLAKQRRNGRHHVRLEGPAARGSLFEDLCVQFLEHYPEGRRWFDEAAAADIEAARDLMVVIGNKVECEERYLLSQRRQQHICAMLQLGAERIKNVLR